MHGGATYQLRFKRRTGLLWRAAGAGQILQLIVIAPLGYRLRKGSKLLYRQPAFLLCTDPDLDPQRLIETYLQRWGIEVNFREEKTLLGVGQAQVRSAPLGGIRPRLQRRCLRLPAPRHPARLPRLLARPAATPQVESTFSRYPPLHPAGPAATPRRSLEPRTRSRPFLRLRACPHPYHEAGEMRLPPRLRCLLRKCLSPKGPKASAGLKPGATLETRTLPTFDSGKIGAPMGVR